MILCCGEALIDFLPDQTAKGQAAFVPHCGGALFNTAVGLGQLGASVGMVTGLSSDPFGQKLRKALVQNGVDTQLCQVSEQPTPLAFVHLEEQEATYSFVEKATALHQWGQQAIPDLPETVSTLVFGGISLCNAPVADRLFALVQREAGRRLIYLDPNIRLGFADNIGEWRDRVERAIALCDILKLSVDDAAWLLPGAVGVDDILQTLAAKGPRLVILTQGAGGVSALGVGGHQFYVQAEPVEVTDTVGAGDAFTAGFLAYAQKLGLLKGHGLLAAEAENLRFCIQAGVARAGVAVTHRGAVLTGECGRTNGKNSKN